MTRKSNKASQKKSRATGINIEVNLLDETDILRGDIPRSRYVERALENYNEYVKKVKGYEYTTILQDFSMVPTPESPAEQSDVVVEDNSLSKPEEVAEAVTS